MDMMAMPPSLRKSDAAPLANVEHYIVLINEFIVFLAFCPRANIPAFSALAHSIWHPLGLPVNVFPSSSFL
jgi:hypothetical protein